MKYIKTFEIMNSDGMLINPIYKVGDYILVDSRLTSNNDDRVENGILVIEGITDYWYIARYVEKDYVEWIYEDEIVKKLDDYEIEALKYNL